VSIESLRSSADSSNLELVTLQGEVHLSRSRQYELGGKCGNTTFTLQDDTGSTEVTIRRANRLIEQLREGDRVRLTAQIRVFRNRENLPVRICVQASEIQHPGQLLLRPKNPPPADDLLLRVDNCSARLSRLLCHTNKGSGLEPSHSINAMLWLSSPLVSEKQSLY